MNPLGADHIHATYWIETPWPVEHAVESMAGEQSSGTFITVPGETDALRERHRAKVVRITPLETVDQPSLPGSKLPPDAGASVQYQRAEVELAFPLANMGANLPTLMSTLMGNLYELREFSGLKLIDIQLPAAFGTMHPGPQFGVAGTRRLVSVPDRPIIGTIIKPSVGLTPAQTAGLVRTLGEAGIDFIKDDELLADPPHSPLRERVRQVMNVINELADHTGKKIMFAFNISGETDAMRRHHDLVQAMGGTCVMVSLNSVGLGAVQSLRKQSALPIHGHRNGWGMYTRSPALGVDFSAYQKIWRLAGMDHLHVNGLQNKFWESDDSVVRSIKACLTPMFDHETVMPVVSSGQWGGQALPHPTPLPDRGARMGG